MLAYAIAGVFALGAIIWSLIGIAYHFTTNVNDAVKNHIITLHFMVPVYALCSWLALVQVLDT